MRLATAFSFALCCVVTSATIRGTDKEHHALCVKKEENNVVSMSFRLKLNTDPQGLLRAINNADFNLTPHKFTFLSGCSIAYDINNKVYTVISEVDLDTVNPPDYNDNLCGMTVKTISGVTTYEYVFAHNILTNGFAMLDDKDRVYQIQCTMDNSVSNVVSTSTSVTAPNLDQIVTPASLSVDLFIDVKTSTNTYVAVSGSIPAGSTIRLRAEYDRTSSYSAVRDVYGVNLFLLEAGSTTAFTEDDFIINDNGCATRSSDATYPATLPIVMEHGFRGSGVANKYVLTSGDIMLWKYKDSDIVYFKAFYDICFEPNTAPCINLCSANGGSSLLRKKRSTNEGEYGSATTYIRVTDEIDIVDNTNQQNPSTADAAYSTTLIIALGAVLGVLVLMMICVLVCVVTYTLKNSKAEKHCRFENMSSSSSVPSQK